MYLIAIITCRDKEKFNWDFCDTILDSVKDTASSTYLLLMWKIVVEKLRLISTIIANTGPVHIPVKGKKKVCLLC